MTRNSNPAAFYHDSKRRLGFGEFDEEIIEEDEGDNNEASGPPMQITSFLEALDDERIPTDEFVQSAAMELQKTFTDLFNSRSVNILSLFARDGNFELAGNSMGVEEALTVLD